MSDTTLNILFAIGCAAVIGLAIWVATTPVPGEAENWLLHPPDD